MIDGTFVPLEAEESPSPSPLIIGRKGWSIQIAHIIKKNFQ